MRLNEAREPSCERSEGGSPKRSPEGDVGDLCRKLHKGLAHLGKLGGRMKGGYRAQVFEIRRMDFHKGMKCRKRRYGVDYMNTLDLR